MVQNQVFLKTLNYMYLKISSTSALEMSQTLLYKKLYLVSSYIATGFSKTGEPLNG